MAKSTHLASCPACGSNQIKVVDSRRSAAPFYVRRRRKCLGCGHRFSTYEISELEAEKLKHSRKILDKLIEYMRIDGQAE